MIVPNCVHALGKRNDAAKLRKTGSFERKRVRQEKSQVFNIIGHYSAWDHKAIFESIVT
jgi:hypothetical protein